MKELIATIFGRIGSVRDIITLAASLPGVRVHDMAQRAVTIPEDDRHELYRKFGIPGDSFEDADGCLIKISDAISDLLILAATGGRVKPDAEPEPEEE